jgi:hypothetical protein
LLVRALENLRSGRIAGGGAVLEMDEVVAPRMQAVVNGWTWLSQTMHWAAGSFVYCTREGFYAVGGFSLEVYAGEEIVFSRAYKKWARERGWKFRVIDEPPVVTSSRKLKWYSARQILGVTAMMVLFPWAVRSKRLCGFWYRRPG